MKQMTFWLILALPFLAAAGENPVAEPPVTPAPSLAQARIQALAHSKTLRKAELSINAAQLGEQSQLFSFFPTLSLTASANETYQNGKSTNLTESTSLALTETLWDGGKNRALLAIDRLATQGAREAAREAYYEVLDGVDAAYFAVLQAQASLDAAHNDRQAAQTAFDLAQAKWEAGSSTKADFLQAEATLETKGTAVIQAQRTLAAARGKLSSLTTLRINADLESPDFTRYDDLIRRLAALDDKDTDSLINAVRGVAVRTNPALAQKKLSEDQSVKSIDHAAAGYGPTVSLTWNHEVTHDPTQNDSPLTGSLTLSATLPLNFWETMTSVESAKTSADQARLDSGESLRTLELTIETTVLDCLSQARAVLSGQKSLEYAQSHYELVLEKYRLSNAAIGDLNDAAALVSTNRQTLITARYGLLSDFSTLRSLGTFESDAALEKILFGQE